MQCMQQRLPEVSAQCNLPSPTAGHHNSPFLSLCVPGTDCPMALSLLLVGQTSKSKMKIRSMGAKAKVCTVHGASEGFPDGGTC